MAELLTRQGTPFWVPDSSFSRRSSTFRGVWRVKRPLNPTKQGPLRPYRRDLRNGSRITFIRLRCFEKSPENQGNTLKKANRRRLADPRAPQQGSSANGGRPWPSLADTEARPSNGRAPVRLGDPLSVPRQPVL